AQSDRDQSRLARCHLHGPDRLSRIKRGSRVVRLAVGQQEDVWIEIICRSGSPLQQGRCFVERSSHIGGPAAPRKARDLRLVERLLALGLRDDLDMAPEYDDRNLEIGLGAL